MLSLTSTSLTSIITASQCRVKLACKKQNKLTKRRIFDILFVSGASQAAMQYSIFWLEEFKKFGLLSTKKSEQVAQGIKLAQCSSLHK